MAVFDIDDSKDTMKQLQTEFPKANVLYKKVDVSNRKEVQQAFNDVHTAFDSIDIVVNGAGIMDEQNVEKSLSVNVVCDGCSQQR